ADSALTPPHNVRPRGTAHVARLRHGCGHGWPLWRLEPRWLRPVRDSAAPLRGGCHAPERHPSAAFMQACTFPRRLVLRRAVLALGLGALAVFGILVLAPEAQAGTIDQCITGVDSLVDACLGDTPGMLRSFACKWAGGMGYAGCIAGESLKHIATS